MGLFSRLFKRKEKEKDLPYSIKPMAKGTITEQLDSMLEEADRLTARAEQRIAEEDTADVVLPREYSDFTVEELTKDNHFDPAKKATVVYYPKYKGQYIYHWGFKSGYELQKKREYGLCLSSMENTVKEMTKFLEQETGYGRRLHYSAGDFVIEEWPVTGAFRVLVNGSYIRWSDDAEEPWSRQKEWKGSSVVKSLQEAEDLIAAYEERRSEGSRRVRIKFED